MTSRPSGRPRGGPKGRSSEEPAARRRKPSSVETQPQTGLRFARALDWNLLKTFHEIVRAGGFGSLRRPTEDTLQLGGDFVVAEDGTLRYGFWGEGPDDRPTVDELIEAVAGR